MHKLLLLLFTAIALGCTSVNTTSDNESKVGLRYSASLSFEYKSTDKSASETIRAYTNMVYMRLLKTWAGVSTPPGTSCELVLVISPEGSIQSLSVPPNSQETEYERELIDLIHAFGPFPKLPDSIANGSFKVRALFRHT